MCFLYVEKSYTSVGLLEKHKLYNKQQLSYPSETLWFLKEAC